MRKIWFCPLYRRHRHPSRQMPSHVGARFGSLCYLACDLRFLVLPESSIPYGSFNAGSGLLSTGGWGLFNQVRSKGSCVGHITMASLVEGLRQASSSLKPFYPHPCRMQPIEARYHDLHQVSLQLPISLIVYLMVYKVWRY